MGPNLQFSKKKKKDLGYYKMKEKNLIPFNTYLSVDKCQL